MSFRKILGTTFSFLFLFTLQIGWCIWSPFQQIWDDAIDFWFDMEREVRSLFR